MENGSNSIIKAVIASVLTAAILYFASLLPGVWAWIKVQAIVIEKYLTSTTQLPRWILFLLVLMSLFTVATLAINIIRTMRNSEEDVETFKKYTNDSFFGATWRWKYVGNRVEHLWAFCSHCDTRLVYSYDRILNKVALYCETCNQEILNDQGNLEYLLAKVERQIDRKVRTGDWLNIVQQTA